MAASTEPVTGASTGPPPLALNSAGQLAHQLRAAGGQVDPVFAGARRRQEPGRTPDDLGDLPRAVDHGHDDVGALQDLGRRARPFGAGVKQRPACIRPDVVDDHRVAGAKNVARRVSAHHPEADESDYHDLLHHS